MKLTKKYKDRRRSILYVVVTGIALSAFALAAESSNDNKLTNATVASPEATYAEAEHLRSQQRAESNEKAVDKYMTAGRLWQEAGKTQQAAEAYRSVGLMQYLLGKRANALLSFQRSLELCKKGHHRLEESKVLNELSYLHFMSGNSYAAHRYGEAALKISRNIQNVSVEAQALSNIGETYYGLGSLTTARKYQQDALALWRKVSDQDGQAHALLALGFYSSHQGEPKEALDLCGQALELFRASKHLHGQTRAWIAIGNIRRKTGDNQAAFDAYHAARALAEQTGDLFSLASSLGGIGYIYFGLGEPETARGYVEKGTAILESMNERWGTAEGKMDLGRIHHALNDFPKALEFFNDALAIFKELSMPRLQAQTLRDIGRVYASLGDTSAAFKAYEHSVQLTRIDQDQRHEAYTLNYIGELYEKLGHKAKALDYYRRALPLSRKATDPVGETLSLYNLARLERDQGNLQQAQRLIDQAVGIADSHRTKVFSQDLRSSYFATVQRLFALNVDVLMQRHKLQPDAGFDDAAFAVSEKARARSLLELMQEARANVREGIDPELLKQEETLRATLNAKAQQQTQLQAAKNKVAAQKIEKEISDLTVSLSQVRDRIKAKSPRYASLSVKPLNLKEVQQTVLDDDSILLQYMLGHERSYVWAVARNDVWSFELASGAEIEQSATRLYKLFTAYQLIPGESLSERQQRQTQAASSVPVETALLSKLVLGPLSGKLGRKRLLIVADGALQYIPFAALFDPDSPPQSTQFLFANHEVVNQPSASFLAVVRSELQNKRKAEHAIAVLADPVFEVDDPRVPHQGNRLNVEPALELRKALRDIGISSDGVQIPRLYASRGEADAIMSAAPSGLLAVGFDANRRRVLGNELSNYRIVHFATHGLVNSENPDLSGIVLSLFDEQGMPQDGFLRLHDIYNLNLPADLVVLSACSTGLGKDVKGEGLIGLTRGFMYAGASGIVASLWKVDDEATAELMSHFYEGLFNHRQTPAAALRSAQLKMSQDKRWQAPYYWAGFVIQGQYNQQDLVLPNRSVTPKRVAITAIVAITLTLGTFLFIWRRRRG